MAKNDYVKVSNRGHSKRKIGNACQPLHNVAQCEPY